MNLKKQFLTHSPINFHFAKNHRDFNVEEVPLYDFSGQGEHTIVKIRKKGLTTWELLQAFSDSLGVKRNDIGYAGLKDKEGSTIQCLSIHKSFDAKLAEFSHPNIKIIETTKHNNKIKLGHLKGNKFFIRLKKVLPSNAAKLSQAILILQNQGMPNYFGYQRFGNDGNNGQLGREICEGKRKEKNKKLKELLVNAYQSQLFNDWLSLRVTLSHLARDFAKKGLEEAIAFALLPYKINKEDSQKITKELTLGGHFYKILTGEALSHYPHGKLFFATDIESENERFLNRNITPVGLLSGNKMATAQALAGLLEEPFVAKIDAFGDRRFAWIWPEELSGKYIQEEAQYELSFFLPRGCYATTLLEELSGGKLFEDK